MHDPTRATCALACLCRRRPAPPRARSKGPRGHRPRPLPTALAILGSLAWAHGARADGDGKRPPPWSGDFTARVEALAVLQTLNAELLSHDSATLTLDRWCDTHHLASPAKIVAVRDKTTTKEAGADQRKALGVTASEPIRYRRVKLTCGAHVLSEADNWYVPARLTPEMNHQLETTDIAFGRAVQALHFQRRTLSARLVWSPLPDGWEVKAGALPDAGAKTLQVPHEVLQHQAVLTLPDGTPFSTVVETYTEEVLAFPQPRPAP
jgi:chorismate-pyruvate lyase